MLEPFRETFIQLALIAGILIGGISAYLGVFVILKRIVFVGIALAEMAALGVALGFLLGINEQAVSFILTLMGVIFFWFPHPQLKTSKESLIGYAYAIASGLAVIFLAKNPMAEAEGLDLISGNLLFVNKSDLIILTVSVLLVSLLHFMFYKEFVFASFDKDTATTLGLKANFFDFLIYLSIGFIIAVSMKIAGIIFVFSALIIPALIGLTITPKLGKAFLISILSSIFSVFWGIYFSFTHDLPTGPAIVSTLGILFLLLFLIKYALSKLLGIRLRKQAELW